ncbi:MAG: hemerythrin domain-containing protein [Alphaproteobacteria bacterium]|nr:hemerythrin domain-containing protein [Alphaproteobacteria bacterium]
MPRTVGANGEDPETSFSPTNGQENQHLSETEIRQKLARNFKSQLGLCALLEDIADSLPHNVSRNNCLLAAQNIQPIVQVSHKFEEEYLFPLLLSDDQKQNELEPILTRLHAEHCEDESYCNEIVDALEELASDQLANIDKLSYMLRGFFEGMRRHIAFEQEHLLPLLAKDNDPQ